MTNEIVSMSKMLTLEKSLCLNFNVSLKSPIFLSCKAKLTSVCKVRAGSINRKYIMDLFQLQLLLELCHIRYGKQSRDCRVRNPS
jgi:hypothetical protein